MPYNGPWKGLFGTVLDRLDGGVIIGDLCDSSFTPKELKGFTEDTDPSPSRVSDELHSIQCRDSSEELSRYEALLLMEGQHEACDTRGEVFVDLRNVRRLLDIGDEVRMKIGRDAERPGLIVAQEGDMLTVQFNLEEFPVRLFRIYCDFRGNLRCVLRSTFRDTGWRQ